MLIQFNFVQQCIQISTRINSSNVHTYIFVCSTCMYPALEYLLITGFVDPKRNTTKDFEYVELTDSTGHMRRGRSFDTLEQSSRAYGDGQIIK